MTISMMFSIVAITEYQQTAYAEKYNKENCEDNNGEWIDGECTFMKIK
jgi:hypothetical protein